MRSIVRRDTGESYQEFLTGLAQGLGDRDSHARGLGAPGPQAQEEDLEPRLEASGGFRREDREDERWADAPGLQSRACGGPGDRGAGRRHPAGCRPRRYHDHHRNRHRRSGANRRRASRGGGTPATGRDHRRQGLSQQSDHDRAGRRRHPVLRRGAGPWSPRLVAGASGPGPGICQSAADSWTHAAGA